MFKDYLIKFWLPFSLPKIMTVSLTLFIAEYVDKVTLFHIGCVSINSHVLLLPIPSILLVVYVHILEHFVGKGK